MSDFASDLTRTLSAVLPDADTGLRVRASEGLRNPHVVLSTSDALGIKLHVDGEMMFRFVLNYRCKWNDSKAYLAVEKSSYKVMFRDTGRRMVGFDYLRDPSPTIPASHVNLDAHNDEVVWAMMASGKRKRGRDRARSVVAGRIPRLAELHFPTGGHRFRPSLEDVLQMLITEFGLDVKDGWQAALDAGRLKYRLTQLRTAVSDAPHEAAAILEEIGWTVRPPDGYSPTVGSRFNSY